MGTPGDGWTAQQIHTRTDLESAMSWLRAGGMRADHRRVGPDAVRQSTPPPQASRFGVVRPARSTAAGWLTGRVVPKTSQEPAYLWMLSALGVPVDDYRAWLTALDRVRSSTPPAVPPTDTEVDVAAPAQGHRSSWRWIAVSAAVVLGLLTVVAVVAVRDPETSTDAGPRTVVLADDFSSADLDPDRWLASPDGDLIRARDGALELTVAGDGPDTGVLDRLSPRPTEPFTRLDADIAVAAIDSIGPGFASITVFDSANRPARVLFGPSSLTGIPEASAQTCPRSTCAAYDDYTAPTNYESLTPGRPQPVRFDVTDDVLVITLSGAVLGEVDVDGPLTGVTFEISAAGTERWQATIDDLVLSA